LWWHNFLTNAIKFFNRNSTINLQAHLPDVNTLKFCVADPGAGMTKDTLRNLFKTRVSSTNGTEKESSTSMACCFVKN
jgi:signal transduction histidine kinase